MAFRSTAFDPMEGQQLRQNDPNVDFASMEMNLAKEMARMKIVDEKKKREIEKICGESEELKELQNKIKAAYLNKERSAQITETQFRTQQELVSILYSMFLIIFFSKTMHKSTSSTSVEKSLPINKQDRLLSKKPNNSIVQRKTSKTKWSSVKDSENKPTKSTPKKDNKWTPSSTKW